MSPNIKKITLIHFYSNSFFFSLGFSKDLKLVGDSNLKYKMGYI